MADPKEFSQKIVNAVEAKTQWYDENVLPKIVDNYRLLHTCVRNLYDLMIKKSLIKPDPYKLDKKILKITPLDNSQYIETERTTVIGSRFSEFETMLDWICTYYRFSVDHLTIPEIKELVNYTNSFQWNSLSPNNAQPNTRGLAQLIVEIKHGADVLTNSSVNDIISRCQKAVGELMAQFKDLTEFQKEVYKAKIREQVFSHPKFDAGKAFSSAKDEMAEIRRVFPSVFANKPFYGQLVEDLVNEDQGANSAELQNALLQKLSVVQEASTKKKATIDTKELLMGAVQSLGALSTPLGEVYNKLNENNNTLQSESSSFFSKLMVAFRKAFNIAEKPIFYEVVIVEQATNTKRKQKVDFHPFCDELQKKMNFFGSFAVKNSAGWNKIAAADSAKILDFLNRQLSDMQRISILLKALDDFFKNTARAENKGKIKGLSMELMAIKNDLVNTNQRRAEYISYVEEEEQMKKLGITN